MDINYSFRFSIKFMKRIRHIHLIFYHCAMNYQNMEIFEKSNGM